VAALEVPPRPPCAVQCMLHETISALIAAKQNFGSKLSTACVLSWQQYKPSMDASILYCGIAFSEGICTRWHCASKAGIGSLMLSIALMKSRSVVSTPLSLVSLSIGQL